MPKIQDTPKAIKPFIFHGLQLEWRGSSQAIADCPLCGKEGKFFANVESGLWDCKSCGQSGNPTVFLRKLWDVSDKVTSDYEELMKDRGILFPETLMYWGVVRSVLTGEWLVPGYSAKGEITNLYAYRPDGDRMVLKATSETDHALHRSTLEEDSDDVYVCEGPWDGMVWWEALRQAKVPGVVVAVPGAPVFKEGWLPLLSGKTVHLLYDNDHPNPKVKVSAPFGAASGLDGMIRASRKMMACTKPPREIRYLRWGENTQYDLKVKSGYDVRDFLRKESDPTQRGLLAKDLIGRCYPIPQEWVEGVESGKPVEEDECLTCTSWKDLINAWRKAMKWTAGLQKALAVMLSSVMSTEMLGEQLWLMIMAPPSCLDGDTPIYDPVDGSTLTVRERWESRKQFAVWSKKGESLGICQALPPQKSNPVAMYEVTFSSGRRIRVTGGHRFWDGASYVALHTISDALLVSGPYPLPTISDTDLLARQQDVFHSTQTIRDFQSSCYACSYPDGEQLPPEQGIVRYVSPSLDGVLVCTQRDFYTDGLLGPLHRCSPQYIDPLSSFHGIPRNEVHKDADRLLAEQGTSLPFSYHSGSGDNIRQTSSRLNTSPPESLYLTQSNGGDYLGRVCIGSSLPYPNNNQVVSQFPFVINLDYGELNIIGLSLQTKVFCERVFLEFHGVSDTSGLRGIQPSFSRKPLQDSYQIGISQSPVADVLPTKQGFPYISPITRFTLSLGQSILTEVDSVVKVEYVGEKEYFDFHVPETENYWACGLFHHNSGKSTLCEALASSKRYVTSKSTLRAVYSGFKVDKEGTEDFGIIPQIKNKTLVIKDADTILKNPDRHNILAQYRDLYDGVGRSQFNNGTSRDYENVRFTIILCGTASLYEMDSAEAGARYIKCAIMDDIDPEYERDVNLRVANRAFRNVRIMSGKQTDKQHDQAILHARGMTGGYLQYLRTNAERLLNSFEVDEADMLRIIHLGEFVALARARAPKHQEEIVEREFSSRLVEQFCRLGACLTAVMGKKRMDQEVFEMVRSCALDTARGRTLNIVKVLYEDSLHKKNQDKNDNWRHKGMFVTAIAQATHKTEDKKRTMLRFLKTIGVVETHRVTDDDGHEGKIRWRLTARTEQLYREITNV